MNDIYTIQAIAVIPNEYSDLLYLDREVELSEHCVWDHKWIIITKIDGDRVYIKRWHWLKYWMQIVIRPLTKQALRYNEWKPEWHLVHFPSLEPLVKVLEFGAKKYSTPEQSGVDNWKKPMDKKQILDSMIRHLVRLMEDEELDSESNLPHIGHIMANAMFYSYHSNNK